MFYFPVFSLLANPKAIRQLDSIFIPSKQQFRSDPYAVIQNLSQLPSEKMQQKIILAQSYLLKSHCYANLEYPDIALENAKYGLALIKQEQQPWLFHHLQLARAYALDRKGTPQKGLKFIENALTWATKENDSTLTVLALDVRANLLISLVDYIQANKDLERAFSLAPEEYNSAGFNLEKTQGHLLLSFAMIYEYRNENKNSIEYFERAVTYHRENNEWYYLSGALYGLGLAQRSIGNIEQGQTMLTESLNIAKQINDFQGAAYSQKELAIIQEKLGNIDQAITMNLEALDTFKQANNIYMFIAISHSLFRLSLANGNIEEAQYYIEFANKYINKKSMPYQDLAIQLDQTRLLAAKKEYKKAYQLTKKIMQKRYQLNKDQSSKELSSMRTRYDLNAKEQKNKLLQQEIENNQVVLGASEQNNRLLFIISILAVLVSILILYYYLKLKKHKQILEKLANIDGLTGLYNRRKGLELISFQLDLAKRHKQSFCLVLVDLDWFKKINDTFGHGIGDQVLVNFALICKQTLRHTDIIIRYGGEEFLIALPLTELKDAKTLLLKLKNKMVTITENIGGTFNNKEKLVITFSAGVGHQYQNIDLSMLINQADLALYQAKNDGRNRIVAYQDSELIS